MEDHPEFGIYDTFNNMNNEISKNNLKKIVYNNKDEINCNNKSTGKNGVSKRKIKN